MKTHIIFASIFLFASLAMAQEKKQDIHDIGSKYIGHEYSGYTRPKDLELLRSYKIDNTYNASLLKKGNVLMIWFKQILFLDTLRKVHFRVIDVLTIPELESNQKLLLGDCHCGEEGDDKNIVAIGINNGSRTYDDIVFAWRLNRNNQKIEVIPTENVQCFDFKPDD
jgi:hypothetical protein